MILLVFPIIIFIWYFRFIKFYLLRNYSYLFPFNFISKIIQLHQQTRKSSMIVKFLYFVIFRIRWSILSKLEVSLKPRSSSKNQHFEIFQVVRSSTCIVYSHLARRWIGRIGLGSRIETDFSKRTSKHATYEESSGDDRIFRMSKLKFSESFR